MSGVGVFVAVLQQRRKFTAFVECTAPNVFGPAHLSGYDKTFLKGMIAGEWQTVHRRLYCALIYDGRFVQPLVLQNFGSLPLTKVANLWECCSQLFHRFVWQADMPSHNGSLLLVSPFSLLQNENEDSGLQQQDSPRCCY